MFEKLIIKLKKMNFIGLVKYYNYDNLQKIKVISFYDELSKFEINNLCFLNKNCKVDFHFDDYENVFESIKHIDTNNEIKIFIKTIDLFNKYIIQNDFECLKDKNILIVLDDFSIIKFNDYLNLECVLNEMINPALNLSPLEKFIYAYNIVKYYKQYNLNKELPLMGKNLCKMIDGVYIDCVGFSNLLSALLKKLGINNKTISIKVDDSYDNIDLDYITFDKSICVTKKGHRRLYVYLKDEKYNIDGFYLSDPTWDNNLFKDYYNHMLFTESKNDNSDRYEWVSERLVFNVNSINEFNDKFNFLLRYYEKDVHIINNILGKLAYLDPEYIIYLQNKYTFIDRKSNSIKENYDLSKIKNELGNYIIKHTNNEIDENVLKSAIEFIYKKFELYENEEKIDNALIDVFEYNMFRDKRVFPERFIVDKNSHVEQQKKLTKTMKKVS